MPGNIFIVMKALGLGCRKKKLKGQLVFEFLVGVLIFFGILFYVLNYLNCTVSGYREGFGSDSMWIESYKIGELLIMNKGNWSGGVPSVVGLAKDWPVLDEAKIRSLNAYCSASQDNYQDLKNKLDIEEGRYFAVIVDEIGPGGSISPLVKCPSDKIPEIRQSQSTRYGILANGNVVVVYSYVW